MAKILIIEERVDLANLVRSRLEIDEHAVETIYCGGDAQGTIQSGEFDLIIADWELPKVAGLEILKQLRSAGDSTPLIMLVGKNLKIDREHVLDEGADECVAKPFDMTDLSNRVNRLLETTRETVETIRTARSITPPTAVNNAPDPFLGAVLDQKYELAELIGGGGSGLVYRAIHKGSNKPVAVKMLFPHMVSRQLVVRRFQQEAKATAELTHPNIVKIIDFGTGEQGQPYLVMEFLDGSTLSELIKQNGKLLPELAVKIIFQAASGLLHAHEKNVVHRDIKANNIVIIGSISEKFLAKIVDFGLAKPKPADHAAKITVTGEVFGSPAYMSPEQCRGDEVDSRADIYSLGCVLFEALTGKPPFVGKDPIDIIFKHCAPEPASFSVSGGNADMNELVEHILSNSLEKDRDLRYQSIEEMHKDLSELKEFLKTGDTFAVEQGE